MEKKHRKSIKPKNRFTLCCFCVGSSKSDVEVNVPYERHEAYDYVVEKLAIKRVPISLFATDEDLAEIENASRSTVTTKTTDYKATPKDKRSAAVFSNYYSMIQKTNFPIDAHKRHIKLRSGSARVHADKRRTVSKNVPLDLITKVKKPIPAPKQVPADVSKQLPNQTDKQTKVKAEIHKEQLELKNSIRMTPQLQETLNALGARKRPDGSPSINHRTINRLAVNESNSNDNKTAQQLKKEIATNSDPGPIKVNATDSSGTAQDISNEGENLQENKKTTKNGDNAQINSTEASSSKAQSQKWKIIIKEHDDSSKSSEVDSTDYTTDSEFD